MREVEFRTAAETAISAVAFEPPIDHEYCARVYNTLRRELPGATLDVFHRITEFVVQVRDAEGRAHELVLPLI